jgi:hypothetical protein
MATHPAEGGTHEPGAFLCHKESRRLFLEAEGIERVHWIGGPPVLETMPLIDVQDGFPVDIGHGLDVGDPCKTVGDGHGLTPFMNYCSIIRIFSGKSICCSTGSFDVGKENKRLMKFRFPWWQNESRMRQ